MRYVLVQETGNPENTWYYIMDDSLGNVLQIVDIKPLTNKSAYLYLKFLGGISNQA